MRATRRPSLSSSASGSVRHRSRAASSSSRIWPSSSRCVAVRLLGRVEREPERAERVLLPHEEERHRHRDVLVDARLRERLLERVGALRLRRLERLLAVCDPVRVAGEHVPQLPVVEARGARDPRREEQRAGLLAVRVVRGVDDLLGRHEPQQSEQVDRAPDRGVEEDAALAREAVREVGEVGDPGVGEDQLRAGVRVDEALEPFRDRRQAATGVDQDRNAALGGEREDGSEPLVVEQELLRARMELDPAGAEIEAAFAPPRSALRRARAARTGQGGPPSARRTRASGRCPRGSRVPVGLVEAEHVGARDAVAVHVPMSSSRRPTIPSMSVPRCVWASKMSRSSGRSARTRSSQEAATCPARSSASIELNLAVSDRSRRGA